MTRCWSTKPDRSAGADPSALGSFYRDVPFGLCHLDLGLRFVHINRWLAAIHGFAVEEHIGRPIGDLLPELAKRIELPLRRVMKTGEPSLAGVVEADMPVEPGRKRVFSYHFLPVKSDDGMLIGVNCVVQDITEGRRVETALRETEERFRQIAENVRELFFLSDARDDSAVYVNPAYEQIFGRPRQMVYDNAQSWQGAVHPDDRRRVAAVLKSHGRGRKAFEHEYRIIRPDGKTRSVRDRVFPVRNEAGEVYRIVGITEDITDRKEAETLLRRRNSELTQVVRLSTMGEMVAEVAHEITQPLFAIGNFAKACINLLAADTSEGREQLIRWMRQIEATAESAGKIVGRLRGFVSEKQERVDHDLQDIIAESIELLGFEARRLGVTIRCESPGPTVVRSNRVQMQQVIVNLLKNAYDAVGDRTATDRRVIVRTDVEPDHVHVSIEDNGAGISLEGAEGMFEAFYSTKQSGFGLGLSVSRTIIENHGGRLWATSNPQGGATFHFTLASSESYKSDGR